MCYLSVLRVLFFLFYVAHTQCEARPNRHAFMCYLSVLRVLSECIACVI